MKQPTFDNQTVSLAQLLQAQTSCTAWGNYIGWIWQKRAAGGRGWAGVGGGGGGGGGTERESTEYGIRKFYSVRPQPRLKGCKLNNTPLNTMHTVLKLLTLECCKPKRNRMYRRIVMIIVHGSGIETLPPPPHSPGDFLRQWFLDSSVCVSACLQDELFCF